MDFSDPCKYGTVSWFRQKLETQGSEDPAAYFGYLCNGYHRLRYTLHLCRLGCALNALCGAKVLDIGCATGDFAAMIYKRFRCSYVCGIDFVDLAVSKGRAKFPELDFRVQRLPKLEFADQSFDAVTAIEVLYYLSDAEKVKAIDEIRRVLKPGGVLLCASVLGPRYLSETSMVDLMSRFFQVECVWFDYFKVYQLLIAPIVGINKLWWHIEQRSSATNVTTARVLAMCRPVLGSAAVKVCVKGLRAMGRPMLRSTLLPKMVENTCRSLDVKRFRSHITVLCRKDGNGVRVQL